MKQWDGAVKGVIPLLAKLQSINDKVHPVMDYIELNIYVEFHTGDAMVTMCDEKVRKWRQLQGKLKVLI